MAKDKNAGGTATLDEPAPASAPPSELANKLGLTGGAHAAAARAERREQASLPADAAVHAYEPGSATPLSLNPRDIAIGEPGPGKTLFLVSLHQHRSRVVNKTKDTVCMADELPVWAENRGDAWEIFTSYHVGMSSIHTPEILAIAGTKIPAE